MNQLTLTSKLWTVDSDERFTPDYILTKINRTFTIAHWAGYIDLDPCTSSDNPTNAKTFKTIKEDSLNYFEWHKHKRIYLNPPSLNALPFIDKLLDELANPNSSTEVGIVSIQIDNYVDFDCNIIQLADVICFPKKRIKWVFPDKNQFSEHQSIFCLFTKQKITTLQEINFYDFDCYKRCSGYVNAFIEQFQSIGLVSKPCILD